MPGQAPPQAARCVKEEEEELWAGIEGPDGLILPCSTAVVGVAQRMLQCSLAAMLAGPRDLRDAPASGASSVAWFSVCVFLKLCRVYRPASVSDSQCPEPRAHTISCMHISTGSRSWV